MKSMHHGGIVRSLCQAPIHYLLVALSLTVLFAEESAAQTRRVLLLGDSWAEYIWDGNNWQSPLAGYGLSQWSYEGNTTALGGTTASVWREPSLLNIITTALNSYPTIDIVHLSIGGNDMLAGQQLGGWHTGLSSAQEDALFDQIQADIEIIVDHILSVRPNLKIGIVDYDYLNLWELSLAGIAGAQLMQLNLGNPSPNQVNTAFANMGLRKRAIANARDRVEYIHNWGLQQYYAGHPGFWDAGFIYRPPVGPGLFPFPGYPAAYTPYPGGSTLYPTPRSRLANNGDDGIHLSDSAYRQLVSNTLGQFFGAWLVDTQGPRVQSITRLNASPTVAQQVAFQVNFNEAVRSVAASDFQLTTSGAISGAAIISVSGSGATRTVTVDRGIGGGTLRLDFVDNDTIYDLNWRPAGYDLSVNNDASYSAGQAYEILSDPPSVSIVPGAASPSLLNAVPFSITFDKAVTGFTSSDIQLNSSGPGTATVTGFNGSGTTYTFNLFATRSGTLTVNIVVPENVAFDGANQGNLAGSYIGFQFDAISAAQNSPYLSSGTLGPLELEATDSLAIFTGSGPSQPTYTLNGGSPIAGELIDVGVGDIVAKFNFTEIDIPAGVAISVTGDNPLAIAGTQDIYWDGAISVSGAIAGRAGGGRGGEGGSGGPGGAGGVGASTGGSGGPQVSGGAGGNNDNSGFGQPGAGRSNGSPGNSGSTAPNSAAPGGPGSGSTGASGFAGFGSQGQGGNGGGGGSPGVPGSLPNGGAINSASGGNGGTTDPIVPLPGAENGTPGQNATVVGANGVNGTVGAAGSNGGPGDVGNNGQFLAPANDLSLAAGPGGGAGGGGGGAAGGQGGGKGGGGSSGAGGGGGGASCPFCVPNNIYCGARANAFGGAGGPGGAGGAGGNGGQGGTAPQAASGGDGGNGGGVIVIAARGLLSFNGSVDISAGPPESGGSAQGPVAGQPGVDPGNNWSPVNLGGSPGAPGTWSWDLGFGCLSPLPMSGGTGGTGTRGGRGGAGGAGGASGISGSGGNGGLGVPGMLKLHGSVVLAQGGQVLCDNHTTDTNPNLAGRFTVITNLANPGLPTFSDDIVSGNTRNDAVLRGPAPYDENLGIPLLPQLAGGVATSGIAAPGFWNTAQATSPGTELVELVQLSGLDSPFADFDQLFVINTGGADGEDIVLNIGGYPPFTLASLPDGAIWTTTVPDGTPVSLTLPLNVSATALNADIYVGDALSLDAQADGGVPPYTFRWLRDEVEVQQGPNDAYTVANVSLADAGTYRVEVTDQLLDSVSSNLIEVLVDAPISIQTQPQSATLPVGSNQTFNVAVTGGKLPLNFDWQLDGLSLGTPSQSFLNINGVAPGDAGHYTVVISDRLAIAPQGLATSDVAVLEVDDPLNLSGPSNVTAYENAPSVTFSVVASGGVPPYSYEWRFAGTPLPLAEQPNSDTLTLLAPLAGKAGAYSVRVIDSDSPVGEVLSTPALLTLVAPLSITSQPADLALNVGTSGSFSVATSGGIPPIAYSWRKDGQPLAPGLQPNGPILSISNADMDDEGDYDVIVSDSGDNTETSDTARLDIATTPLSIVTQPVGARGYTTEPMALTSHTLSVAVSGGLGSINYLWLKDGQPAPGSNDLAVYTLDPMTPADSGRYRCQVSDAVGPLLSDEALVEVAPRITFNAQPEGGQAAAGGSFSFSVEVGGGLGDLSYVWKRQNQNKTDEILGSGPVLELSDLESGDTGIYYCEVSDDFETQVSALALLEVTNALPFHDAWLLFFGILVLGMGIFLLPRGLQRRSMR